VRRKKKKKKKKRCGTAANPPSKTVYFNHAALPPPLAPNTHSSGLRISLGFFDDVLIPPEGLPRPSAFDHGRGAWVYRPGVEGGGGDGGGGGGEGGPPPPGPEEEETDDLEMAPGAVVRFRVREVRFPTRPPLGRGGAGGGAAAAAAAPGASDPPAAAPAPDPPPPFAPLEVVADFTDVGLGPVAWWNECEDAAAA